MKRRKKIWIACAALAVVVALCAFALLYRPLPYRFLNGATLEGFATQQMTTSKPAVDLTYYSYRIRGTLDTVVEDARRELTLEKGWDWHTTPHGTIRCRQIKGSELINFTVDSRVAEGEPQFVFVSISHDTTPIDRVIVWLLNR